MALNWFVYYPIAPLLFSPLAFYMSGSPEYLWLSVSPSLKCFDRPLLQFLAQQVPIARWEYQQTLDEGSHWLKAVNLLHNYVKSLGRPVHVLGHGMAGVVGLLYARHYPERVRSLTLLAVAPQPANTWHAHYYVQRHLLPCDRHQVLAQTVQRLFGQSLPYPAKDLVAALNHDLAYTPHPHSLLELNTLPQGGIPSPLLVCGSSTDPIVTPPILQDWWPRVKPQDYLWECPDGRHFFHYFHPDLVGTTILEFWQSCNWSCLSAIPHLINRIAEYP